MNTTTFQLEDLNKPARKVAAKPTTKPKPAAKRKREHWTVQFMRHVDALGDELRKQGKVLK